MDFAPRQETPYSRSELLKCRAFVVFAHAEIQVYFEAIASRVLARAERDWRRREKIGRVIAGLIAFSRSDSVCVPDDPAKVSRKADFRKIIEGAFAKQREIIRGNNGIKRANVAKLLCPLGLFNDQFSEVFLIQLDQPGKRRGEMVHKSSRVSLQNIRDPFADEHQAILKLLDEVRAFDQTIRDEGLIG